MVMYKLKKTHTQLLIKPCFFIELRLVKPMLHSNTSWNVNFFESFLSNCVLFKRFTFSNDAIYESYTKLGPLGLVVVVTPPCLSLYSKHL